MINYVEVKTWRVETCAARHDHMANAAKFCRSEAQCIERLESETGRKFLEKLHTRAGRGKVPGPENLGGMDRPLMERFLHLKSRDTGVQFPSVTPHDGGPFSSADPQVCRWQTK